MKRIGLLIIGIVALLGLLIVHILTSSAATSGNLWHYLPIVSKGEATTTPALTKTSTPTPTLTPTITPTFAPNTGPVLIENGAGTIYTNSSVVDVDVAFTPTGTIGEVTEMRIDEGLAFNSGCPAAIEATWEPFAPEKTYTVFLFAHYHLYRVSAQYSDSQGNLSPIYCDDVIIIYPTPTLPPGPG